MEVLILSQKSKLINGAGEYIVNRIKKYCTSCKVEKLTIVNYCCGCGKNNK